MAFVHENDIWASLPFPAMIVDSCNAIERINPAAESFLNRTSQSLEGHPIVRQLFLDADAELRLDRAREGQNVLVINDARIVARGQKSVPVSVQLAPLQASPEKLLVCIQSRVMADRLVVGKQMKSAAKSAIGMAEMLTHEIKNPLAGISGAAQLLLMSMDKGDHEMIGLILEETRRILTLVEQVEQFSDQHPPERSAINIHDILQRARSVAEVGFASGMQFVSRFDPSLPMALANPDQMVQVFLNLIRNAAEAAGEKGRIELRTHYDAQLSVQGADGVTRTLPIQAEIIDDGPGLPPEIEADIFDPFVSGRANGTGLGLPLVSKIMSDQGGWISVDSRPGCTIFRVSLAVAD